MGIVPKYPLSMLDHSYCTIVTFNSQRAIGPRIDHTSSVQAVRLTVWMSNRFQCQPLETFLIQGNQLGIYLIQGNQLEGYYSDSPVLCARTWSDLNFDFSCLWRHLLPTFEHCHDQENYLNKNSWLNSEQDLNRCCNFEIRGAAANRLPYHSLLLASVQNKEQHSTHQKNKAFYSSLWHTAVNHAFMLHYLLPEFLAQPAPWSNRNFHIHLPSA